MYQFVLQIKQDILQGRLPVSFELGAELFALSLQSELGDYDPRRHDKQYVSEFHFLPNQTPDLEEKVAEIHKGLSGQVSSMVEMAFLEKVKWLDMYGVDLHVVMGEDNVEYFLCLTPSGIIVMKNSAKISNYFWPRITKTFFKGKYFMLRVRNKANEENTFAFELPSKDACRHLWKCCVEHHAFFRLTQVKDLSSLPFNMFRLGSKHRYSGRTEQQIRSDMKQIKRLPPTVVRVPSRRYPKRLGEPDGAEAESKIEEQKVCLIPKAKDDLLLPQTICSVPLYRSVSTPAELSTVHSSLPGKTAPWEEPNQRGLFSNSSRQSLCSSHGSEKKHSHRSHSRRRSPSVDSEVSSGYRRKRHKGKRSSDNDSDISKSSKGSRGSKSSRGSTSHRKSKNHSHGTGSDSDSHSKKRERKCRGRSTGVRHGLIDSEAQWKMVQMQKEKSDFWPQSAVVRDLSHRKSGYMNSGIDTESELTFNHRKKHRRHSRSRSRSPDPKQSLSSEIKKHIKYNLVDASDLTAEEKRDIKYTKVETEKDVIKVRRSPSSGRPRYKLAKVSSRTSLERMNQKKNSSEEDPPPPYSATSEENYPHSNTQDVSDVQSHERNNCRVTLDKHNVTSDSAMLVSDSSSSSVSSALKTRKENHVSPSSLLMNQKVDNSKVLQSSLLELSGSGCSSGTESNSNYRFINGNYFVPNTTVLNEQEYHTAKHTTKKYDNCNHAKPVKSRYNRNMKTEL